MTSLGQELKKDREARGISLKAVADTTRITQRYLEALESDQLDILPGRFFVKSIFQNVLEQSLRHIPNKNISFVLAVMRNDSIQVSVFWIQKFCFFFVCTLIEPFLLIVTDRAGFAH